MRWLSGSDTANDAGELSFIGLDTRVVTLTARPNGLNTRMVTLTAARPNGLDTRVVTLTARPN